MQKNELTLSVFEQMISTREFAVSFKMICCLRSHANILFSKPRLVQIALHLHGQLKESILFFICSAFLAWQETP